MTEYNEGDLVRATKEDSIIQGRINHDRDIVTENVSHTPSFLEWNGWCVSIIEHARPPLPAEVGAYLDVDFRVWVLDQDGWHVVTDDGGYFFPEGDGDPEEYAPFTRLVPEVTA